MITFQTWLIALCYSLAAVGIIFGLFCILFNVIFRRRRYSYINTLLTLLLHTFKSLIGILVLLMSNHVRITTCSNIPEVYSYILILNVRCNTNCHLTCSFFRIVRLTSPNLNYLIVIGAILTYCTIFVYLIPTTNPDVYKIRCYVSDC